MTLSISGLTNQEYISKLKLVLEKYEGKETNIYLDSASPSHPTIGIGFDLSVGSNLRHILEELQVDFGVYTAEANNLLSTLLNAEI